MTALSLLRERKVGFDVVISDVHMPDMDGFKLLELVGLEMDLPVISGDVCRWKNQCTCSAKKWNENRDHEHSGSFEDSDNSRPVTDEAEYASSGNEGGDGSWKAQKKKRDCKEEEDDGELENEDPSASKKPRVVWSVELHQQFVNAVNQLGIDKAVPKRILELMNVPGLTRENVASHLQKFRLYLKRISGVMQHQVHFLIHFVIQLKQVQKLVHWEGSTSVICFLRPNSSSSPNCLACRATWSAFKQHSIACIGSATSLACFKPRSQDFACGKGSSIWPACF
ncbi:hypothetical protein HPP92_023466 [Vanilla planifolia]|uniref:HTH myb-type domain-containing protein n=1 Tax=Vanilla planifolia TaxID=51239 RepID=A0A835PVD5_VANPL|nr:hypothetical protein HPP92_023466 [Vanilla planifolia]